MPIHHSCFKNPFEEKYLDLKWENGFPYSNYYADRFFQNDALAEIKNIFIEPNQIRERIEAGGQIHIGELGFGLGLNFFVTAKFWHENNQNSDSSNLEYLSIDEALAVNPVPFAKTLCVCPLYTILPLVYAMKSPVAGLLQTAAASEELMEELQETEGVPEVKSM